MVTEIIVPVVFFLVVGVCFIVYFYLRSRERELIIQKGLTPEQMVSLFNRERKYSPLLTLKVGIIVFFFGLGIASGMLMEELMDFNDAVGLTLFPFLGLGFVIAFFAARKFDKNGKEENQPTV